MKSALVCVIVMCIVLLGLTCWLTVYIRGSTASFFQFVISEKAAGIEFARQLEDEIRRGQVTDALARLQNRRDELVISLDFYTSAMSSTVSWKLARNDDVAARGVQTLRSEVKYRIDHGESKGPSSSQATEVLSRYK